MNWNELICSAIIGGIIGYSVDKFLNFIRNVHTIKCSYKGIYYSYRYSTSNDKKIVVHKWKIYRRCNGTLGVKIEELEHENPFKYRGYMWSRDRYIYVHLCGLNHSEDIFYIFPEPIEKVIVNIRGILLAISMNNTPWAGEEILVNEKLSIQKAKNILGSVSTISPSSL